MTRNEKRLARMISVLTLADILFPVEKIEYPETLEYVPVSEIETFDELGGLITPVQTLEPVMNTANSDYKYDIFAYPVFNGVKQKIRVNSCSDRYELVPNVEIFPVIEQILSDKGIEYDVNYSMVNHAIFYVTYTINDPRYLYSIEGTNDKVKPQITVMHSYNGLVKYKIIFGYFRLVCTNGLTIPVAEMSEFNLCIIGKHTKSILESLHKLNDILQMFADNAENVCKKIVKKYDVLAKNIPASINTRIENALKEGGIISVDNKSLNTLQYIINKAENDANNVELGYNGTVNDWLIYNAINSYLFDSTLNMTAMEKQMEKDSKVFEYLLKTIDISDAIEVIQTAEIE